MSIRFDLRVPAFARTGHAAQYGAGSSIIVDLAALRASGRYLVITPEQCRDVAERQGALTLHPLMGGIAPARTWSSLRLLEREVLPFLGAERDQARPAAR